jgi:class 3 adenylate cyclase
VPVVAPVRGADVTWFVVAPVSLEPIAARLGALAHERFGGDPEALVIVDVAGRTVAHVDPERAAIRAPVASGALAGVDGAALAHGVMVFHAWDAPGGERLGLVRSLPGLPWAVVAELPAARAYAPLARVRLIVIAMIAAVAVIGAGAAVWLARRAARPVGALVAAARDLGERRFDRPVAVHTGDELETLAEALNAAAADLAAGERAIAEQAAIRRDLGRYLPAQLVERIVRREHSLELGGERRTITVLFVDVAAFTPLVERLPPDRIVTLINELFTLLTELVFRHGGTVDKFIGDCVMAMWNAPDDQPDHAARAVAAAIDMQRWLDAANDGWEQRLGVTLHLAIGVHTGEAVVGNLGSEARMDYTCLGDTVNVAARLEALARPQQILVSDATRQACGAAFRWLPLGRHALPGRLEPVELHEALV